MMKFAKKTTNDKYLEKNKEMQTIPHLNNSKNITNEYPNYMANFISGENLLKEKNLYISEFYLDKEVNCFTISSENDLDEAKKTIKQIELTEKSQKQLIRALIKDVFRNELAIGIVKVYHNPHCIVKLFWFISLIGVIGLSSYLITSNFIDYFDYEVITTSRTIFETPTVFPKV